MFMPRSGRLRSSLLALALLALPVLAGCSSNPFTPPIDDGGGGLPPSTPNNDSPQNTMLRFEATFENQVKAEYEKLFASNFRFTFSSQSDPLLAAEWGASWGKDDEIESTGHLFEGFTDQGGVPQPPAAQIRLSLDGASYVDDPFRPDSAAYYKLVIVPTVNLSIQLSDAEQTEYQISAPHDFYLVRGDIALLDEVQEARADRWYIYRWDDKSPDIADAGAPRLASHDAGGGPVRSSWGLVKGTYAGSR
jgi:hypothetical protein